MPKLYVLGTPWQMMKTLSLYFMLQDYQPNFYTKYFLGHQQKFLMFKLTFLKMVGFLGKFPQHPHFDMKEYIE